MLRSKRISLGRRDGGGWKVVLTHHAVEVGYADIRFKHEHAVEIVWFQIYDECRGQGYGRELLKAVVEHFPNKHLWVWSIIDSARPFWEKMMVEYPVKEE